MKQITFEDFLSWQHTHQPAAETTPIKIIEVVVEHDGARLFADGNLELTLDRDPELDTHYRTSEIENCFIDTLVMNGTIDERLTDDTEWCRKVVVVNP